VSICYGHVGHIVFGAFVWAFVSEHYRVANFDELFRERTGAKATTSACIATTFALLLVLYFSRNDLFPRGLLVCDILAIFCLTILLHAISRHLFRSGAGFTKPSRTLFIGADEFAFRASQRLRRLSFAPCAVAGYVRLPGQSCEVHGHRVYELEELPSLTRSSGIDEVVIAINPAQFGQIPQLIQQSEHLCLPTRAIVDLGEGVIVRERLFQLGNIQMLDLTRTPTEFLDYALAKRAFDVFFSTAVLFLTAPLFVFISLVIRLTSPGPIFFIQERVGLSGKSFAMYKFRTMQVSSKSDSDVHWTSSVDPRRTWFGRFLRQTSLDELPQFINVLKGEMSVVGPRPERPFFVHKFLDEFARYDHRHSLKVGITGWAQVNGWRGDTSIEKRVEYDLYYLQNWSMSLDLRIILMTLFSGLINRNAY
jgi:Undecaprenyl-phosphate glucose phosphotransferase